MNAEPVKRAVEAFLEQHFRPGDLGRDDDIFASGLVTSLWAVQLVVISAPSPIHHMRSPAHLVTAALTPSRTSSFLSTGCANNSRSWYATCCPHDCDPAVYTFFRFADIGFRC